MDTDECIDLHFEIREFFDGLFLTIKKEFPVLLVEKQALNKPEQEEKIVRLSSCSGNKRSLLVRSVKCHKCKTFQVVKEGPKMGPNNKLTDMVTETQVVSGCPVTAILIIYGLPRLLTGYILAHEMMHAYLRLNGCNNLNNVLEEGICQVLGHMWLETQRYAPIDVAAASSSSNASKKGEWSEFEKKLVQSMVKGLGKLTIWCQITASRKPSKRFFPAGVEEEEDESAHIIEWMVHTVGEISCVMEVEVDQRQFYLSWTFGICMLQLKVGCDTRHLLSGEQWATNNIS
ncbi:hypothetical protein F2Q70_00000772 [Brassica cretica]|uniref:Protein DA1-like domain-containing protein n=1 Tax=Brassica cretica TaxID=69181 RepID=A0A8S9J5V7_BRACR|nr:hypothetical protein F2Q70_00000772 [Brassica cretica]